MSIPYVFGLNYATSGFEMREKLAFSRHEIPGVLERLQSSGITKEIIILSTCNRTEIYCTTHDIDFVINAICDIQNVCPRTVKKHSYIYLGEQCANHLFRVVSGLESMVLGETEIVAQVKDALSLAAEKNSVGTQLSSVFQMALAVEKDVRNATSINNIAISIGHALQSIVAVNFNNLINEQILFIGAGDMMQQVAPHFRDIQFAKKTIVNRTLSKAENIALKINANVVGIEDLNKIIDDYSIIVACSGLDRQILNEQIFSGAIANKKLLIIDLSMPLISDLSLRKYSNIMLLTIDDIAKIVDVGVEKRKIAAIAANNIINNKLVEYQSWLKKRELTPVIRALRDNAEDIRREALLNAQKQLAGGESAENVLHELSIKLTNRLIHNPTVNLCSSTNKTQQKLTELITYLYNLKSMKQSFKEKLEKLAARLQDLSASLAIPEVTNDIVEYTKINKEYAELLPVVDKFKEYTSVLHDLDTANELLADSEMREFAQNELDIAKTKIAALEIELQKLLLPKDANDEKNIYLEIRAGTGGDESALFSSDLFRMYCRFAERNRWQVEVVSESSSDLGGYKEIIARIIGHGAYSKLKFESGAHRVQRIPVTESQGRIHTSACTVAVMPEADEVAEVNINPTDLKIDTFRASGAGGQHINKTDSAIRITHIPTGMVVECQDDRSQHKNKARAMSLLATRIKDAQERAQHAQISAQRKSLVGSGDRSERIRTYNFPQGRMTDHRINLTLYKLEAIMDGDLYELTDTLIAEHQAELLANIGDE